MLAQQLTDPNYFQSWEKVGIVGLLVCVIFAMVTGVGLFLRALYNDTLWTGKRAQDMQNHWRSIVEAKDADIESRDRIISDQQRTIDTMQRHAERRDADFDRVLGETKTLLHDVVMAKLRPGPGPRPDLGGEQ